MNAELALDLACLKERNNILAVRKGMPAIGAELTNAHGIKWAVDGHTSAPTLLAPNADEADGAELYPRIAPLNLSKRLTEFVAEVDRCTPKAIVALDTMPLLFPKRGHPGGHWVDATSDSCRVLLFVDAVTIHETALAHEIGHVWIDLVKGIEDHRTLKDRSDVARYAHVQHIQSFVLDVAVNQTLQDRGFDMQLIAEDWARTIRDFADAAKSGYRPSTPRESAYVGSFLASSMLETDGGGPDIVRYCDHLLALRPELPEEYALAERLAAVVRENPPENSQQVRVAVDAALEIAFAFCEDCIDIERELIEVPNEVDWDQDKYPEWLRGQNVHGKCEVGIAMARLNAGTMSLPEMSYGRNGKVRVRFLDKAEGYTEYAELEHITSIPGILPPWIQANIEECAKKRKGIDQMSHKPTIGKPLQPPRPRFGPPTSPGQRTYTALFAGWIARVRLAEQLGGEHAYTYANSNPVTYFDPTGDAPQRADQVTTQFVQGSVYKRLTAKCGVSDNDAKSLATAFSCIAFAESTNDPAATAQGVNSTALGLTQLSAYQYRECTTAPRCRGKKMWRDPECNLAAAVNIWISMCNNPTPVYGSKHGKRVITAYDPNGQRDPLSAMKGTWGCVRGEGDQFAKCMKDNNLDPESLRTIKCPPKSNDCPGCNASFGVPFR